MIESQYRVEDGAGRKTASESKIRSMHNVEFLTGKDLEALLQIDRKTIYGYVSAGTIPYVRIQSNLRFRKQEIEDWIEQQSYRPCRAKENGVNERG